MSVLRQRFLMNRLIYFQVNTVNRETSVHPAKLAMSASKDKRDKKDNRDREVNFIIY